MHKTLIFSGVPIDRTPVVKYTLEKFATDKITYEVTELEGNRFSFVIKSIIKLVFSKPKNCIFIGLQTLPILFVSQIFSCNKINWFLESYSKNENNSLVLRMLWFEEFINWKKIAVVFPIKERIIPYKNKIFSDIIIYPNASKSGKVFINRSINGAKIIKLVFYGALDPDKVYLTEYINFVKDNDNLSLDIYGLNFQENISKYKNIKFHGLLRHDELITKLKDFHYSIIGYKPTNFNTKYCAPNKLFEALSMSLPVLLNSNNPTLVNFPQVKLIGYVLDFSNLGEESNSILLDSDRYQSLNKSTYNLYENKYNLNSFYKQFINILK